MATTLFEGSQTSRPLTDYQAHALYQLRQYRRLLGDMRFGRGDRRGNGGRLKAQQIEDYFHARKCMHEMRLALVENTGDRRRYVVFDLRNLI
jgi:hypothetical protein